MPEPRLFLDARAILAESPVWDAGAGELVWTDITNGLLHRTSADGAQDRTTAVPPPLAAVQLRRGGGLVAAVRDRILLLDDEGGEESVLASIEQSPTMRLNEGKVDPFGNFVVGGLDLDSDKPDAGVFRITPEGEVTVLAGGFGTTNGFEWNDDGSEMYLADTDVETVFRASYGADGVLGGLLPFNSGGSHDGFARDERGEFWGAVYGAGSVVHLDRDGRLIETIAFPAPNLTGVGFGGDDLRTLFVCSARENMTEAQLEESPLAGGLFALGLDRAGRAPNLFG